MALPFPYSWLKPEETYYSIFEPTKRIPYK
jgi:hypothetical protein